MIARALACALACAGCGTPACGDGTVFLSLEYDAVAAAADQVELAIQAGAYSATATKPHAPGATLDTVEVDFPAGYPGGQRFDVAAHALASGRLVGNGTASELLGGKCAAIAVQIFGGPQPDGGAPDAAAGDLAGSDAAGPAPDLAGVDAGTGTLFEVKATYVVNTPGSVVAGDFTGDGKLDLAVLNASGGAIVVLPGIGDGTFGAAISTAAPQNGDIPSAGDLDGDGKLDLALAGAGGVEVFLGHGDGTFAAPVAYPGPVGATLAADWNGDGALDLAVADFGGASVDLRLGSAGVLGPATKLAVGAGPYFLLAGDFDGDGKRDLASAGSGANTVSVLLGLGDGSFGAATDAPVGTFPASLAAGDFDGDGKLDLATCSAPDHTASILLGKGGGAFLPQAVIALPDNPAFVAAGDWDRDGHLDLALSGGAILVLLGRGDGSFALAPKQYPAGNGPTRIAVGDWNGDKKPDLAVVAPLGDAVTILVNVAP